MKLSESLRMKLEMASEHIRSGNDGALASDGIQGFLQMIVLDRHAVDVDYRVIVVEDVPQEGEPFLGRVLQGHLVAAVVQSGKLRSGLNRGIRGRETLLSNLNVDVVHFNFHLKGLLRLLLHGLLKAVVHAHHEEAGVVLVNGHSKLNTARLLQTTRT